MLTLNAVGSSRRYPQRVNKIYASSSFKEVIGGMHGGERNFVSDTKFESPLRDKFNIARFY